MGARFSDDDTTPHASAPTSEPPVVGIGASAGGLGALREFFRTVPEDCGIAFVVVVHLSPDHESHLAELLQRYVPFAVRQVTETTLLEPNCVYVIPPGRNLSAIDTHLRLSDLEAERRERAPIDHFFRSLADTHNGRSVGVVLTGTGSDGTLGVKQIKEHGGLTIAQDPNEAQYDGMPKSAIATGLVDLILPIDRMFLEIHAYFATKPRVTVPREESELEGDEKIILPKVFTLIRARTGRDFSRYKQSTILRRIQRRMQLRHVVELPRYLDLLRDETQEVQDLADDFLITVTHFFRDREVFEKLERDVIPQLFTQRAPDESIRVWSVGCATGEEAYSLAILLIEAASRQESLPPIQVFASDLHDPSLGKARDGFFPGDIESQMSEERLQRFFQRENGGYRVRKEVREFVLFAPHNILSDPPFSKLDLIICRNLLIYLRRDVQKEVIELFHYSLRPEGVLVLGSSETIEGRELFRIESKQHCLFRKRNVPTLDPRLPVFPLIPKDISSTAARPERTSGPVAYASMHQRLLEQYGPPSMLLSPDHKVMYLTAHAGRYLGFPAGEITANAFKIIREELRIDLRATLHAAQQARRNIRSKALTLRVEGGPRRVVLDVRPALEPDQEGFALVIFDEDLAPESTADTQMEAATIQHNATVRELETDLQVTKQRLQAIIEEYETTQEEMRASNEEMQSSNEELRSTLEELETSKEELQSMNEELQTVNQENRHKVEELAQLSSDLHNLLAATGIATLFLDRQFRILRFTPKVSELFNVRAADCGRPISDITHRLGYNDILSDTQRVLRQLTPIEKEVKDDVGRWHLTRVLPYRSPEDRIEGVVITFVDITQRKTNEEELRQVRDLLATATAAARLGWGTWRLETGESQWDARGRELMAFGDDETGIDAWFARIHPEDRERVEAVVRSSIAQRKNFEIEYQVLFGAGEVRRIRQVGAFDCSSSDGAVRGTGLVWEVSRSRSRSPSS